MRELCGPPPLLATEKEKDFAKLAVAIIETVEPIDAIEWISTNDVVNHAFEVRRYRRLKVGLMQRCDVFSASDNDDNETATVEVDDEFAFRLLARTDAELFNSCSSDFELADRLETMAQARLARALNQIDARRDLRGRLHVASNRIISDKSEKWSPGSPL
jgi:hypothetical protein